MINIQTYIPKFLDKLNEKFTGRIYFVGLQGSYARNEATKKSDLDIIVIFDQLEQADVRIYNKILDSLPDRDLICGFISGKEELFNWDAADLFNFIYDTTPIQGNLNDLKKLIDNQSIEQTIKRGLCSIYHVCLHNMLHEKSSEILKGIYKSAYFTIKAIVFNQTGKYFRQQKELLEIASESEKIILKNFSILRAEEKIDFNEASEQLFNWTQNLINTNR